MIQIVKTDIYLVLSSIPGSRRTKIHMTNSIRGGGGGWGGGEIFNELEAIGTSIYALHCI